MCGDFSQHLQKDGAILSRRTCREVVSLSRFWHFCWLRHHFLRHSTYLYLAITVDLNPVWRHKKPVRERLADDCGSGRSLLSGTERLRWLAGIPVRIAAVKENLRPKSLMDV